MLILILISTATATSNESVVEYLVRCLKKYLAGPISFWCIWEGNDGTERRQLSKCKNYELKKLSVWMTTGI